ncbi:FAD-dependent oxidoreductase [Methylosinus sporium]|uniref:FAD-dependent oxidoreductase n=1 Tax=Methylosinus sporium TaxID=428 RepID=A0A549T3L9_METSR|nr:FAD-dependent oxidoreductase [Methylosinus sporium]TRL36466.1 FAD-dependent oxidoreductase [Methylosinus sporium]
MSATPTPNLIDTHEAVVIFGGGIAGATLAKSLVRDFSVMLVDPRDFIEVPMAATRVIVDPDLAGPATIAFAEALVGVRHVQGRLAEWTPEGGRVELADGAQVVISGNVTVLATGSRHANPLMRSSSGSMEERRALYRRYNVRIMEAEQILIVGGGPIGVEIAGEISEAWPEKSITLIERGERLLKGSSEELAREATRILEARGVTLITGENLTSQPSTDPFAEGGTVTTDKGRVIDYALLIWATGGQPETAFMRKHYAALLDEAGRLRVDPQLRVKGLTNVFAVGDINDVAENKMAVHILGQAKTAETNIRAILTGRGALAVYKAKTGNPMMLLALGRHTGVSHLPILGVVKAGWLNRMIKTRDMLVPRFRKAFGL